MQYTLARDDECRSYINLTYADGRIIKSADIYDIWEYLTMVMCPGDTITIGEGL